MAFASIDLDGMALMISRLEITADRLHHTVHNLHDRVARAGIDTGDLHQIGAIAAWIDDELPGLRRRLHLAIAADAQRSAALRGTPVQIDEPTMSMAQATAAGRDLAARLAGADATGDPDALAELAREIAASSGDPDVMGALYDRLGGGGTLDVMTRVARLVWDDPDELTARTSLLEALKGGLSTAQIAWSDAQSRAFATTMVDLAARQVDASAYDHPGDFAAAMSYLLYDSHHGDAFLSAVAERMDHHEQITFNGWPEEWTRYSSPPNQWIQYFPTDASNASWDPGVSLMSALANNPQTALDFFAQGSQQDSVTDRQMHWLHDRDWSDDQFAHLSEALLAATTDPGLTQPPDSACAGRAAHLASMTVNLIGHRDNINGSMISGDQARTVAAEYFALIISTYLHGVDRMLDTKSCKWDAGGTADWPLKFGEGAQLNSPRFNRASLDAFIALAASTETGFATLRLGLDTYAANKYAIALNPLAAQPDDPTAQGYFTKAYKGQAKVDGLFMNAIGDSAIAEARGKDQARAAWVALGTDAVSAVPFGSLVTKAGGGLAAVATVSFTVAQAKKQSGSALTGFLGSDEAKEVEDQNELAEEAMHRARYQVLATAAQYPSLMAQPMPDSESWAVNGVPLPWGSMSDAAQEDALGYLQDSDTGVGRYFDQDTFETLYEKEFQELFELGDG